MRSHPKESWIAKREREKEWHDWYAWRPVPVYSADHKQRIWVWRELVQRKKTHFIDGDSWTYRTIK